MKSFFRFWKDNSYIIIRCIAIQVGMTMFGVMLSMATYSNQTLLVASSILSVVFYLYLLYDASWNEGSKEKVRVDAGRLPRRPHKGFFFSLCANFLNIGFALAIWVCFFIRNRDGSVCNAFGVIQVIASFVEGMYSGVIAILNNGNVTGKLLLACLYTLIVIPAPLSCWLGYYRGLKDARIFPQNPVKKDEKY